MEDSGVGKCAGGVSVYRVRLNIDPNQISKLRGVQQRLSTEVGEIVRDAATVLQHHAVQNLSGVPFEGTYKTEIIKKQTGKSAASIQVQAPYSSPYSARVFGSNMTGYPGNDERYNILSILEYGRGEIRPKKGQALAIPSAGGQFLRQGENGFRGMSGNYRFVRYIPPMPGKGWMRAAIESAKPEIEEVIKDGLDGLLHN